jgi:prepilin peptidase CpaA
MENQMSINYPISIFIIFCMMIAVLSDLKTAKIPNVLTFSMMLSGMAWHSATNGLAGLGFSAGGLFLGIGIFLGPYLMGGMGAGDVKLLGGVGALLGAKGVIIGAVFSILLGGVYATIILIIHFDYTRSLACRLWATLKLLLFTKQIVIFPPSKDEKQPYLKFGLPIALGTISYVCIKVSGSSLIQDLLGLPFSI